MAKVSVEEFAASVQGQIDAVTDLCALLIAAHADRAKIERVIAGLEANAARQSTSDKVNQQRYAQGMSNVLAHFRRTLHVAGLAEEMRDLPPNQKN